MHEKYLYECEGVSLRLHENVRDLRALPSTPIENWHDGGEGWGGWGTPKDFLGSKVLA